MAAPYQTPKYGWLYVAYLHRLASNPSKPLTFSARTSGNTLRLKLFQGRQYVESCSPPNELSHYIKATHQTRIAFTPPLTVEIKPLEDFAAAFAAIPITLFSSTLFGIHTFTSDSNQSRFSTAGGLSNAQNEAIKLYLKSFPMIRVAVVTDSIIMLSK